VAEHVEQSDEFKDAEEEARRRFPVPLDAMQASLDFSTIDPATSPLPTGRRRSRDR
jgi:hypothetical protein